MQNEKIILYLFNEWNDIHATVLIVDKEVIYYYIAEAKSEDYEC